MDATAARRLLGIGSGATAAELRAAFRAALRRTHPDLAGPGASADRATAEVVAAYRLLSARLLSAEPAVEPVEPPAPDTTPASPAEGTAVRVEGDTVVADLPAGDLFPLLVDVADRVGDVTHADPESGVLELLVDLPGRGVCSVVLTLQGRATGVTEAWCTVEPLAGGPPPPAEEVAALLAVGMRATIDALPSFDR